ncbi:hypothetical protein ACSLNT_30325, partial [Escherichia coli]|uniref:hypothetical protein n=1 Tax=Escherichia coli TaxID=562 RepID=UPI003EE2ECA6
RVIESWLAPLGLSLIRSPSGTHIEGSEGQVRQAMALLINGIIHYTINLFTFCSQQMIKMQQISNILRV